MKKGKRLTGLALALLLLAGCGAQEKETPSATGDTSNVADASEMTTVEDVVEEGMVPVSGAELNDGTYSVVVDSSSSMFRIAECELTVADGEMTAVLTMGGSSYAYVYPGTAEAAAQADAADLISAGETEEGNNTFVFPVPALDAGVDCAAFSKNKEQWYPRTLVFRSDSLPLSAFRELTTAESLGLTAENSPYMVSVTLSGGSGRASVQSPAELSVQEDGTALATIIWSSSNYDYMIVDGEQILPVSTEDGHSVFVIPVAAFDRPLPVTADTTAMSQPHEVEYTLRFDSATLVRAAYITPEEAAQ